MDIINRGVYEPEQPESFGRECLRELISKNEKTVPMFHAAKDRLTTILLCK